MIFPSCGTSTPACALGFSFSNSVIPTGVVAFFFRAVRGAAATEWNDRGNQCSSSQLDETIT